MRITKDRKGISALILILLMLGFFLFGALISYLWVISSYYNMPENVTMLLVENAVFPLRNATYFNVTLLNPSNSVQDVNLTAIRVIVEGNYTYNIPTSNITAGNSEVPYQIKRGTRQTFKCLKNWSAFAGRTVRIEPMATNATTNSQTYTTPNVRLEVMPDFDITRNVQYFNLTVRNSAESVINVTITDITVFEPSINVTPSLPQVLSPDHTIAFGCDRSWEHLRGQNVTITVKTAEGYEASYTTPKLKGAILDIQDIKFFYTDSTYFNMTLRSAADSTASAIVSKINLTLPGGTPTPITTRAPFLLDTFFSSIQQNRTATFKCNWNWSQHRNQNITVAVYTRQGFTVQSVWLTTPLAMTWNITGTRFDLSDTGHFLINVTNQRTSLQNCTITGIKFDANQTSFTPETIPIGQWRQFNCTFNWTSYRGSTVTIYVNASNVIIYETLKLPTVQLSITNANFNIGTTGISFNVTIESKSKSEDANITRIVVTYQDHTIFQCEGLSVIVRGGNAATLAFSWDWNSYYNKEVKVSIYTTQSLELNRAFTVHP